MSLFHGVGLTRELVRGSDKKIPKRLGPIPLPFPCVLYPFIRFIFETFTMVIRLVTSVVIAIFASTVSADTYSLSSKLVGQGFLNAFSWQAITDPTHGRV